MLQESTTMCFSRHMKGGTVSFHQGNALARMSAIARAKINFTSSIVLEIAPPQLLFEAIDVINFYFEQACSIPIHAGPSVSTSKETTFSCDFMSLTEYYSRCKQCQSLVLISALLFEAMRFY